MKVTALAGGVGGAKLLVGLAAVAGDDLTCIVNTGDDATIYSVDVCPDLDIVTYWLAGIADTERGWGIRGDSFRVMEALERLGEQTWFRLGDRDLATCLHRTLRLREGATLTAVTDEIRRALGIRSRILPMSDDPVRTHVITDDSRTLPFQEYFVKEQTRPIVTEVFFDGLEDAKPGAAVIDAIARADLIVICPSNPFLSIEPILGLAGVRDAVAVHPRVIAVTPIVRGAALKGPADRLLAGLGHEVRATAVARIYADLCDVFVIDSSDEAEIAAAGGRGTTSLDTVMHDHSDARRLASALLAL